MIEQTIYQKEVTEKCKSLISKNLESIEFMDIGHNPFIIIKLEGGNRLKINYDWIHEITLNGEVIGEDE